MTETKKQELRVKVAELCGWKVREGFLCHNNTKVVPAYGWSIEILSLANVPDYPNDLNACAEFENAAFGPRYYENGQQNPLAIQYWLELGKLMQRKLHAGGTNCSEVDKIRATATQRCQAFEKVMEEKR